MAEKTQDHQTSKDGVQAMINRLVKNAQAALEAYMTLNQEQVDKIVHAMSLAGLDHHMELAKLACEETG